MTARTRRVVARVLDVLAAVVVVLACLAPGLIASDSVLALVRIPLEAVLALVLLLLLPWRPARRIVAVLLALALVVAALLAALDRVFASTVGRPFDPVGGWKELADGYGVVSDSTGPVGAAALVVLVGIAALAAVALLAAALLRVTRLLVPRRRPALIGAAGVTAGWLVVALVGAQLVPGEPVAAADTVSTGIAKTREAVETVGAQAALARQSGSDPYAQVPASDLLTGLRGKDVIVAFVESYGQVAVQGTSFSPGVDAVLRDGTAQLTAEGYSQRSAFLTSSTFGGISWLAHSTLQTGLWIDSQQKYDQVTAGDRFTLSAAFRKAGWRTVSDVPSDTKPWPVGRSFYHYDELLNATDVGYEGPKFSYARIPDQYTLAHFQRQELARPHAPVMAEIDLVSSHTPWTPLPQVVPWDSIGDGSVYDPQPAQGLPPSVVWRDPKHVQQLYGESVQYSLRSLFSFLGAVDDPNLVLVVLGDHQPATVVSGAGANHDVPISIVAKDPAVIDRISSWKWESGMLPSPSAPVWRMDAFRDRFLSAFGPG
ncbi:CDP-alcohol phosphatidyltransferase [Leifsonia virtsii]|uniref:CDP-alcohol phosphatidyltransferase n=1 Tax=Leifsonia virtsii TaxID=3035915 RepID=A0ABT8J241_9MICO|nr:CDP-alcohol phosphatidyltransferase [Leifsonia virtsii]MDN4599150.1 CDP-alcohol phosphatidyltransferase [Leifsonia virtsii]